MDFLKNLFFGEPEVSTNGVFGVIDIGTSKIVCLIAREDFPDHPKIIGIGHNKSSGMRQGWVSDMDALQKSIADAVTTAEAMCGETLQSVTINISGAQIISHSIDIELALNGRTIEEHDVFRMINQAQTMLPEEHLPQQIELLQTIPVGYRLDEQKTVSDPIGMTGSTLQSRIHLISAEHGSLRTLVNVVGRCHLNVEQIIASPYASGIACLVEDEIDLGSIVIDMGAGTTSFTMFFEGEAIFAGGISIGGAHITSDIARCLTTSITEAERVKTLYGNTLSSSFDNTDSIEIPLIGEENDFDNIQHVPKSQLISIIQPRMEEILELVRDKIDKSGFTELSGRRVVLTGGASQLNGTRELAQRILDKQVRLGKPMRTAKRKTLGGKFITPPVPYGIPYESGPAFAVTEGLLAIALNQELAHSNLHNSGRHSNRSFSRSNLSPKRSCPLLMDNKIVEAASQQIIRMRDLFK
ncbi:MAG: cell division protein FtsA [Alphaproteobacteria bacterium]|nr:cell division protein FtsA [Alphaproteobacteria bacterium]MCL2505598.1 cell division protein FtsA [Alphaproteobacteria bacterium]